MKFRDYSYNTSIIRVIAALLLGACFGAFLYPILSTAISATVFKLLHSGNVGLRVSDFAIMLLFAPPIWLAGMLVFGGPVWIFLHYKGFRTWPTAVTLGGVLPFVVTFLPSTYFLTGDSGYRGSSSFSQGGLQMSDGYLTAFGWKMAVINSLTVATAGALVAVLVWFIAYRFRAKEAA